MDDFELKRLGLRRDIALRCTSIQAALQVIASTDFILTLGARQFSAFQSSLPLQVFDLPFEAVPIDLQIYWRSNVDRGPANTWRRERIIEQAVEML
jgi:DNA-binding transcriptional LysR family regulator